MRAAVTIIVIVLGLSALITLVMGDWVEVTHRPGFWTRDRMKNAKPPVPSEARRRRHEERIAALRAEGKLPQMERGTGCAGSEEVKMTNFEDYQTAPYYAIGKVFFSIGNSEYVCSGSIAQKRNLVWTAAHCIYDHDFNDYVTDWIFLPQYFNNTAPLGMYYATRIFAPGQYISADREEYDYGIAEFSSNFPSSYGSFSLVTNIDSPGTTNYIAYGYPQGDPFDGQFINRCSSLGCYRDPTTSPRSVGIDCTSTGGSSGGPWLVNGNTQIAGVVAYGYDELPGELYSPFFDDDTQDFYTAVVNGENPGADTGDGSAAHRLSPITVGF